MRRIKVLIFELLFSIETPAYLFSAEDLLVKDSGSPLQVN
jgi:hypothetical protein